MNRDISQVVKAAIYPPIGVMRVGNSDEYFIGPLESAPIVNDPSFYRDKTGKLKRQAAEFRIYGLDKNDKIICELTNEDDVKIEWHVQLANQKSEWYGFSIALDIPEAKDYPASFKRNLDCKNRMDLIIDSKVQTLSAKNKAIDLIGKIGDESKEVYLGSIKYADNSKRLHVLGGKGVADNISKFNDGKTIPATTFSNNENWYDDISDGPVTATLKISNKVIEVEPAWVVCGPPDYAPLQKSVRTMWDLMRDLHTKEYDKSLRRLRKAISNIAIELDSVTGMLDELSPLECEFLQAKADLLENEKENNEREIEKILKKRNALTPDLPSIEHDILPIFQRMTDLQWVNKGFDETFGYNKAYDFRDAKILERLNDLSKSNFAFRQNLYNEFRKVDLPGNQSAALWPWIYGDAMTRAGSGTINQHTTLTNVQLDYLKKWVNGNVSSSVEDQSILEKEVFELTKSALDYCLADAFHPGCEMTWPVRQASMYMGEFRFSHADDMDISKHINYGESIDYSIVDNSDVDIFKGQVAGGITRWMAIPWQTDTSSCRDGYNNEYSNFIPTFWPARVPNEILSYEQFKVLQNNSDVESAQKLFQIRKEWLEDLPNRPNKLSPYMDVINSMINHFDRVGIVVKENLNLNFLPNEVQVAYLKDLDHLIETCKEFCKAFNLKVESDEEIENVIVALINENDYNMIGNAIDILEAAILNKSKADLPQLYSPISLLNNVNLSTTDGIFKNAAKSKSISESIKELLDRNKKLLGNNFELSKGESLIKPGEQYLTIAEKFREIYN